MIGFRVVGYINWRLLVGSGGLMLGVLVERALLAFRFTSFISGEAYN